jgi:acetyltransferase-like isoleucine patch superfamily enzyme
MPKLKPIFWKVCNLLNKYIASPRMIMGYLRPDGKYQDLTRISNTTSIVNKQNLQLENNIYIGHYNFIEASNKVTIGEGCQISNYVSILTHSSHISIRLYGRYYIVQKSHSGYIAGSVIIGKYTFIGPHTTIMPNTNIVKGSIISAYSMVKGTFPDFAIIAGNPAKQIGDTRDMDKEYLENNNELQQYYNEWANTND